MYGGAAIFGHPDFTLTIDGRSRDTERGTVVGVLAVLGVAAGAMPAFADDAAEAKALVQKATLTIEKFSTDPTMGHPGRETRGATPSPRGRDLVSWRDTPRVELLLVRSCR